MGIMISKSPQRGIFQKESYIKHKLEEGKSVDDPEVQDMIEYFDDLKSESDMRELDPSWQENNLEYDLRTNDYMLKKVRANETYAQNLYAALCNNDFVKAETWPILKKDYWSCSWRYAGGIVADMRQEGDYINWYCSGIRDNYGNGFVMESDVTDEIRQDLKSLGWLVVQ